MIANFEGGSVMSKNYYVILGIPSDSSLSDIKSAFRRLAKEFHPDYFGKTESPFPAIQEAYSVLSDPERRRKYDNSLDTNRVQTERKQFNKPSRTYGGEVEPLIPEGNRTEPLRRSSVAAFRSLRPESDSLIDRFFHTASERRRYGRNTKRHREFLVTLSEEQVRRGGQLRLHVPSQVRCPECGGSGSMGFYECRRCFGSGTLQGEIPLLLNYPAHIADNHSIRLTLNRYGIADLGITVRFKTEGSSGD